MKIEINIKIESISDLIISALEGGANYWYMIEKEIKPTKWEFENDKGERFAKEGKHWIQDYPLNPGGALVFSVTEAEEGDEHFGKKFQLGQGSIKKGLALMAEKSPVHFADILSETGDAETGDVFLQFCLFGEIIYG